MTITVRSPEDVYEAFIAEFDNAQDTHDAQDVFNSEKLKRWVTDAAHEIYCLGVSDGADHLDGEAVKGYTMIGAINSGYEPQQVLELVDAVADAMGYVSVEDARVQFRDRVF